MLETQELYKGNKMICPTCAKENKRSKVFITYRFDDPYYIEDPSCKGTAVFVLPSKDFYCDEYGTLHNHHLAVCTNNHTFEWPCIEGQCSWGRGMVPATPVVSPPVPPVASTPPPPPSPPPVSSPVPPPLNQGIYG